MRQNAKNIVIIGAGFAGLRVALRLEKNLRGHKGTSITLVDGRDYQLFAPDLYEVAASPEEFSSISQLSRSAKIPLSEILEGRNIKFVQSLVLEIDGKNKKVLLPGKKLDYDYLVMATGSVVDYSGVPGAEKYGLPLKNLPDALRIRNDIEFAVQARRYETSAQTLRVAIAGGGSQGIELAAELSNMANVLAWKNQYPRDRIEVVLVEALSRLAGFEDSDTSHEVLCELRERGVRVMLSSFVSRVEKDFLILANGERLHYDVLVWATGVKAAEVLWSGTPSVDRKGRLVVEENMRLLGNESAFAIGDCAAVPGGTGVHIPPTAWAALSQADYVAYALPLLLANKKPTPYKSPKGALLVTLGGRRALVRMQKWQWMLHWIGFGAYVIRELVHVNYLRTLLGWNKAFRYVWFQTRLYGRNDK